MVPQKVGNIRRTTPWKKVPAGPSELLAQRVRVSLVSVSTRMGRPSPCCASAASAGAAAAPMTRRTRAVSFAHLVGAPRKNAARAGALSRGDSFRICSVSCEDQSRQSVRALDGAASAD
jgi:hypothetical protein